MLTLIMTWALILQFDAQAGLSPLLINSSPECTDISIVVRNVAGKPIINAIVRDEDGLTNSQTDINGVVLIPCRIVRRQPRIRVSAPGFRPSEIRLYPDLAPDVEVVLDEISSSTPLTGNTVGVRDTSSHYSLFQLQKEAGERLSREEYARAEELLLEALQLAPESAWIANNLGVIALRRQNLVSAGNWFQRAAESAPFNAEILANLGLVRWMQDLKDDSYRALTRAVFLGRQPMIHHYILGLLALERCRMDEAVENLKNVSSDKFRYRDLYLSLALRALHKEKAAGKRYQDFLRRNPVQFIPGILSKKVAPGT